MMNGFLIKIINIIGASVCHQLPERSFKSQSLYIPVCARCEGIYLGFLFGALLLFIMFRKKQAELPPLYIIIILLLFVLSTIIDAALSYFSIIKTNNISRFVTGYLSGIAAITIIFPIFNYQYYKKPSERKIFLHPWKFVLFLAINGVLISLSIAGLDLINKILFYVSALGILFTFYFINLVIIFLIPYFSKKATRIFGKYLIIPTLISIFLASIELFISYRFHQFIIRLNL